MTELPDIQTTKIMRELQHIQVLDTINNELEVDEWFINLEEAVDKLAINEETIPRLPSHG